ncbi:hypothetical protein LXJ15735_27350 [Lacrimispora xylanolytica]
MYNYPPDYYEGDFYNEPSEFDEKMEELKSYLMDSVKQDIKSNLEYYKNFAEKKENELSELKSKVKSLESDNSKLHKTNDVAEIILSRITKENVESIISNLYEKTFREETLDCPLHWGLYVNYYDNREQILKILKYAGIKIPYDSSVILPHEWDKTMLDKFFERMGSHVNCNGANYKGNLRFWNYNQAKDPFNYTSYSEIPWQFVLRNPLLNSKAYALKMANEMSCKSGFNNGYKFSKIDEYQDLDDDVIKVLVENTSLDKKNMKGDVGQFLIRHIEHVNNDDTLGIIVGILDNMWRPYEEASRLPERYQIKYAQSLSRVEEKIEFLKVSTLSQEIKAKIFCEAV